MKAQFKVSQWRTRGPFDDYTIVRFTNDRLLAAVIAAVWQNSHGREAKIENGVFDCKRGEFVTKTSFLK